MEVISHGLPIVAQSVILGKTSLISFWFSIFSGFPNKAPPASIHRRIFFFRRRPLDRRRRIRKWKPCNPVRCCTNPERIPHQAPSVAHRIPEGFLPVLGLFHQVAGGDLTVSAINHPLLSVKGHHRTDVLKG